MPRFCGLSTVRDVDGGSVHEPGQILNAPQYLAYPRLHRRTHPERLVNPHGVAAGEVRRDRMDVMLDLCNPSCLDGQAACDPKRLQTETLPACARPADLRNTKLRYCQRPLRNDSYIDVPGVAANCLNGLRVRPGTPR